MFKYLLICSFLLPCIAFAKNNTLDSTDNNEQQTIEENGVTIYQEGDKTIEEYRVKGFLYSVKIIPKNGKPYYLINTNGDDNIFKAGHPQAKMPSWKLFSW